MNKKGVTVVVSMDGSEHSDYALKYYAETLHANTNKVILVHCAQYHAFNFGSAALIPGNPQLVDQMIDEEEQKTKDIISHMEKMMKDFGIENGEVVKAHGEIGHEILEKAKEYNADLIVTGARGKGKFRRTITGSNCDYLVHHSEIPVIVCKHPHFHHHHQQQHGHSHGH